MYVCNDLYNQTKIYNNVDRLNTNKGLFGTETIPTWIVVLVWTSPKDSLNS
jgi:hypothetical protein